jgi:hypothetical protein
VPPSPSSRPLCQSNLGIAYQDLGERLSGSEGSKSLRAAVTAYQDALQVYTKESLPQDWAMTQNNLRVACQRLAERHSGSVEGRACAPRRNRLSECFADPNKKRPSHRRVRLGTMSRAVFVNATSTWESRVDKGRPAAMSPGSRTVMEVTATGLRGLVRMAVGCLAAVLGFT